MRITIVLQSYMNNYVLLVLLLFTVKSVQTIAKYRLEVFFVWNYQSLSCCDGLYLVSVWFICLFPRFIMQLLND